MKKIKIFVSLIISVAMFCNFALATTYYYNDTWSVHDTNYAGAPSYIGCVTDQCDVVYSTYGNRFSMLSISNTLSGAYGHVTIKVLNTNATMTNITLNNSTITAVAHPVFTGPIPGVSYLLTPFTQFPGNTYTASGTANTIVSQ